MTVQNNKPLDFLIRTEMLLGREAVNRLTTARVAVFGVGGVGGYCAEALARSGIGAIDLYDDDIVAVSNINRQIIATTQSVGSFKVDVMKARINDINPIAQVTTHKLFYLPETAGCVDLSVYDYIADAMDTMTAKLELVCRATAAGVPIISAMGAANKMDATAFSVGDVYETTICPVARVMRRELRKRGIVALKVVYSTEPPIKPAIIPPIKPATIMPSNSNVVNEAPPAPPGSTGCEYRPHNGTTRRQTPASNAFVPPIPGLIMAGEIVKDLSLRTAQTTKPENYV